MNAPARPKPLPWDELKHRLDENQPFNMMRNTPYYRDAVYEQFSKEEYARRYGATRAKRGPAPLELRRRHALAHRPLGMARALLLCGGAARRRADADLLDGRHACRGG